MRRPIALLVFALHVLLVWLLAAGFRERIDPPPDPPQFVSLWITPPPITPVEPPPPQANPRKKPTTEPSPTIEPPRTAPITPPVAPTTESTEEAPLAPAPPVDWANQAALAARRSAEEAGSARDTFSEPPKTVRKKCVPKEKSMEWNGAENPGLHWVGPIPIFVTKRCIFTIAFFSCNLGWIPPPNIHLLDDMKDPKRSPSSVPDPNVCD